MKRDIDHLVARIAPDPGPGMTTGARELLREITTDAPYTAGSVVRTRSRLLRRRFAVPLIAAFAACAVAVSWLLPGVLGPHAANALDIRREDGYYVITVKQLFADPARYAKELRDRGLNVSLTVKPVSPGLVGSVMPPFDQRYNGLTNEEIARRKDLISPITRPGGCEDSWSCAIGLKIPVGYRGKASVMLGRKGRPRERFLAFGQLNNLGEPLQCEAFVNRTVGEVRSMLSRRGVVIGVFAVPLKGPRSDVPASWHVHEGWLTEPGKALLVAAPGRNPHPWPFSKDCPARH
ncbi:hypothetical protein GCM10023196_091140 [Actinoallomurus vinaceus]|uniref:Uncharacterized protein n=1 Tax=Actinoallomurus vinaceus TaxID=1080074 RepID=A0ABP8UQ17_9ACTN